MANPILLYGNQKHCENRVAPVIEALCRLFSEAFVNMGPTGLRVAVLGFYGHLNAGDGLLQYALTRILQGNRLLISGWLPGTDFLNRCDLVIVGGGSIWPGHPFFENGSALARQLRTPFAVVGISAAREDGRILQQTKALIEKAIYFHVRDRASKEILDSHPAIRVGSDLLYWVPWDPGFKPEPNSRAVALSLRSYNKLDWSVHDIVKTLRKHGYSILPFPFYFGSVKYDASADVNDEAIFRSLGFSDVPQNWNPEALRTASAVITMRFHALMTGIRIGCPVIGFDFHPKLKNFFVEMGIPELCVPLEQPGRLIDALHLIEENREKYQAAMLNIRDNLLSQGQHDLEAFRNAIGCLKPQKGASIIQRVLRYLA